MASKTRSQVDELKTTKKEDELETKNQVNTYLQYLESQPHLSESLQNLLEDIGLLKSGVSTQKSLIQDQDLVAVVVCLVGLVVTAMRDNLIGLVDGIGKMQGNDPRTRVMKSFAPEGLPRTVYTIGLLRTRQIKEMLKLVDDSTPNPKPIVCKWLDILIVKPALCYHLLHVLECICQEHLLDLVSKCHDMINDYLQTITVLTRYFLYDFATWSRLNDANNYQTYDTKMTPNEWHGVVAKIEFGPRNENVIIDIRRPKKGEFLIALKETKSFNPCAEALFDEFDPEPSSLSEMNKHLRELALAKLMGPDAKTEYNGYDHPNWEYLMTEYNSQPTKLFRLAPILEPDFKSLLDKISALRNVIHWTIGPVFQPLADRKKQYGENTILLVKMVQPSGSLKIEYTYDQIISKLEDITRPIGLVQMISTYFRYDDRTKPKIYPETQYQECMQLKQQIENNLTGMRFAIDADSYYRQLERYSHCLDQMSKFWSKFRNILQTCVLTEVGRYKKKDLNVKTLPTLEPESGYMDQIFFRMTSDASTPNCLTSDDLDDLQERFGYQSQTIRFTGYHRFVSLDVKGDDTLKDLQSIWSKLRYNNDPYSWNVINMYLLKLNGKQTTIETQNTTGECNERCEYYATNIFGFSEERNKYSKSVFFDVSYLLGQKEAIIPYIDDEQRWTDPDTGNVETATISCLEHYTFLDDQKVQQFYAKMHDMFVDDLLKNQLIPAGVLDTLAYIHIQMDAYLKTNSDFSALSHPGRIEKLKLLFNPAIEKSKKHYHYKDAAMKEMHWNQTTSEWVDGATYLQTTGDIPVLELYFNKAMDILISTNNFPKFLSLLMRFFIIDNKDDFYNMFVVHLSKMVMKPSVIETYTQEDNLVTKLGYNFVCMNELVKKIDDQTRETRQDMERSLDVVRIANHVRNVVLAQIALKVRAHTEMTIKPGKIPILPRLKPKSDTTPTMDMYRQVCAGAALLNFLSIMDSIRIYLEKALDDDWNQFIHDLKLQCTNIVSAAELQGDNNPTAENSTKALFDSKATVESETVSSSEVDNSTSNPNPTPVTLVFDRHKRRRRIIDSDDEEETIVLKKYKRAKDLPPPPSKQVVINMIKGALKIFEEQDQINSFGVSDKVKNIFNELLGFQTKGEIGDAWLTHKLEEIDQWDCSQRITSQVNDICDYVKQKFLDPDGNNIATDTATKIDGLKETLWVWARASWLYSQFITQLSQDSYILCWHDDHWKLARYEPLSATPQQRLVAYNHVTITIDPTKTLLDPQYMTITGREQTPIEKFQVFGDINPYLGVFVIYASATKQTEVPSYADIWSLQNVQIYMQSQNATEALLEFHDKQAHATLIQNVVSMYPTIKMISAEDIIATWTNHIYGKTDTQEIYELFANSGKIFTFDVNTNLNDEEEVDAQEDLKDQEDLNRLDLGSSELLPSEEDNDGDNEVIVYSESDNDDDDDRNNTAKDVQDQIIDMEQELVKDDEDSDDDVMGDDDVMIDDDDEPNKTEDMDRDDIDPDDLDLVDGVLDIDKREVEPGEISQLLKQ
jgi:hypothetical protein